METRKLQVSAQGSFMLTLPKSWVQQAGLQGGDNVFVDSEEDGSFRIFPSASKPRRESRSNTLFIESFPSVKLLDLSVKASYIQGNDVTEIASKQKLSPDQKRWIKEAVSGLVGTEISEEFADRVVLLNLLDPLKFHIDVVFQRFSDVAKAIYQDATRALLDHDSEMAMDAFERGKESAKLYRLLMRQVILCSRNRQISYQMGQRDIGDLMVCAMASRELSRLAYYAMRIAQHALALTKVKLSKETTRVIVEMCQIANDMHEKAVNAYLKSDITLANSVIDKMDAERTLFAEGIRQILRMDHHADAVELSLLIRDFRGIAGYAVAIADNAVLRCFPPKVS